MMLGLTQQSLGVAPRLLPPSVIGGSDLWCADGEPADRTCTSEDMCYYDCPGGEQPLPRRGDSGGSLLAWLEANQTAVLIGGAVLFGLVLLGGRRR